MIRLCFTHPFPERKLFPSERASPLSLAPLASSPRGGATGVSVRPTRDEQSLIFSETVVPCYRGQALPVCKLSAHRLTFAGKGV